MPRLLIIWILCGVSLLAAVMLLSCDAPQTDAAGSPRTRPAPAGRIEYLPAQTMGILASGEINESSGLAAGRVNKGVLWTNNDSGDKARIFAFNHSGADLACVNIRGASARDWEDMCSFAIGRKSFLLLADIGDNFSMRDKCTLYVLPEPRLNIKKTGAKLTIPAALTINFKYSDGPHNCESIAVDTTTKTIYLVSKCKPASCKVYAIPLPNKSPRKTLVAKPIASLRIPTTTAMDISPDGLRAVVLTYQHAYEYTRRPDETWSQGFSRKPRIIKMPFRLQGETICYAPDGRTLYLTSEKTPTPLIRIPAKPDKNPKAQ
jgi:hypothetical protein